MKIRTDFVTNSSSSSFVIDLRIQLEDGTKIDLSGHEESGDFEGGGCSFSAYDADGNRIAHSSCEPLEEIDFGDIDFEDMEDFDPEEFMGSMGGAFSVSSMVLSDISKVSDVEELIEFIKQPFGFNSSWEDKYEDEDWESENNGIERKIESVANTCQEVISEHLTEMSDIKYFEVNMEFSGRGEDLASPEDIIEQMFGWEQSRTIIKTLNMKDAEKLRNLKELEMYTDESLKALSDFWAECDYAPDECTVKQMLKPDGKIDMEISFE